MTQQASRYSKDAAFYSTPIDIPPTFSDPWTRPADWPSVPTPLATDHAVNMLVGVYPGSSALDPTHIALTVSVSTGGYQVDWGDGSAIEMIASGVTAQHSYDPTNPGLGTLTADGFLPAVVLVTPDTEGATITSFAFNKPTALTQTSVPSSPVYELKLALPSATTITLGLSSTIELNLLQNFEVISAQSHPSLNTISYSVRRVVFGDACTFTNWLSTFASCSSLHDVTIGSSLIPATVAGMFKFCRSLRSAPVMDLSSASDISNLFEGCGALKAIPQYTFGGTSATAAFASCGSLTQIHAPIFTSTGDLTLTSMFELCESLQRIDIDLSAANTVNINSMFKSCFGLTDINLHNPNSVQHASAFLDCTSLQRSPAFIPTGAFTSCSSMFSGCTSLIDVYPYRFDLQTGSGLGSLMFEGCYRLVRIPSTFDGNRFTATDSMFLGCSSLRELPSEFITALSANASRASMFSGCTSLRSLPGSLTFGGTCSSMFVNCSALESIDVTLPNTTTVSSTFSGCHALETASVDAPLATDATSTFASCLALHTISTLTTGALTSITSMFSSCRALTAHPTLTLASTSLQASNPWLGTRVTSISVSIGGSSSPTSFMSSTTPTPLMTSITINRTGTWTTMSSMFSGASTEAGFASLRSLVFTGLSGITTISSGQIFNSTAKGRPANLRELKLGGLSGAVSFNASQLGLEADGLNGLYTSLGNGTGTITVTGNPGTGGDDPTIATGKGWTVAG